MTSRIPKKIGKYVVISKIAQGGMGVIYKAKHPTLKKEIIIKELSLKRNDSIRERFKREAQIMMDFRNENIVHVYDHFKEGTSYYIAMEYVNGISLEKVLEKKRYLPPKIAILIFAEVCKALKYAHDNGVIHRDIKPDNVLISKSGSVKLADFGIATYKDSEDEGLTSAGMTLGTPSYMSPEQITDTKNVDKRADIYSMGVMLYAMVTGKTPFAGSFTPEAIAAIQKGKYIKPRKVNPAVTPLVQKVIKKAMHHRAKKRYKDLVYIFAVFKKYLKKYKDKAQIDDTIKAYIYGGDTTSSTSKSFSDIVTTLSLNFKLYLTSAIIAILLVLGLSYYLVKNGYYYEYLKAEEYGALQVSMKVFSKKKKTYDFLNCELYRLSKKKYKKLENVEFDFNLMKTKSKRLKKYLSQKIYLKSGKYKIKVIKENQVYQKIFFLEPRNVQKNKKKTYSAEIINFVPRKNEKMPLKVYLVVKDRGVDITNDTELYVKHYSRWIKWEKYIKLKNYNKLFVSGKSHNFKISKDGYYNDYIYVRVKPYQNQLTLETNLVPIPGSLYIKANYNGLNLLLNNSTSYIRGGRDGRYEKIKKTTKKYQKLLLSPGDYFLTAKESDELTKTYTVTVKSNKSSKIIINYNKNTKTIQFNGK